jgi:hypothetical protein|tara:strand:- start:824 stop:1180 length:357 start_codon:yes stop_codon:yes gene_type:complete
MSLSKALEKVASKVVNQFGGDVTIRYVAGSSYDASTGAVSETESDSDVKGVVVDITVREANELVQAGDKRLTVAAEGLPSAPETKDRVVIGSIVYQIIQVQTIEQANSAIIYELVLRA